MRNEPSIRKKNASTIVSNAGIEDLAVDYSGNTGGGDKLGIGISNAVNCWVRGIRGREFAGG